MYLVYMAYVFGCAYYVSRRCVCALLHVHKLIVCTDGSTKRVHTGHLTEHDEGQLIAYIEYMAGCAQPVSLEWIKAMAGRLATFRYSIENMMRVMLCMGLEIYFHISFEPFLSYLIRVYVDSP